MRKVKANSLKRKRSSRNYRKEYDSYYGVPGRKKTWTKLQKLRRRHKVSRNGARRKMKKKFKISHKLDIDHIDGNPLNNSYRNLRVLHRSHNRGIKKKKNK